jgi:hypothetical protein
MTSTQKDLIERLDDAKEVIVNILYDLMHENKDGKQFDYVSSPRLADSFERVEKHISHMERIIYQKK